MQLNIDICYFPLYWTFTIFEFIWYVLGAFWLFGDNDCDGEFAPGYSLGLALTVIYFIFFLLLMTCCTCLQLYLKYSYGEGSGFIGNNQNAGQRSDAPGAGQQPGQWSGGYQGNQPNPQQPYPGQPGYQQESRQFPDSGQGPRHFPDQGQHGGYNTGDQRGAPPQDYDPYRQEQGYDQYAGAQQRPQYQDDYNRDQYGNPQPNVGGYDQRPPPLEPTPTGYDPRSLPPQDQGYRGGYNEQPPEPRGGFDNAYSNPQGYDNQYLPAPDNTRPTSSYDQGIGSRPDRFT